MSEAKVTIRKEVTVKKFARIVVNGQDKGEVEINGHPSLGEFAQELADKYGVNTFNVTVDGSAVRSPAVAEAPASQFAGSRIGIQARDARGSDNKAEMKGGADETAPPQADGDSTPTNETPATPEAEAKAS